MNPSIFRGEHSPSSLVACFSPTTAVPQSTGLQIYSGNLDLIGIYSKAARLNVHTFPLNSVEINSVG